MIDIIMPVKGALQLVLQSVLTLMRVTESSYNLWVVCDNDSLTFEALKLNFPSVSIYNRRDGLSGREESAGFAAICNYGVSLGKSELILFLNSDVRIEYPNWLSEMEKEFESSRVGIVGSKLLYFEEGYVGYDRLDTRRPEGKIQHAGVAFDFLRRPYHIFSGWDSLHPKVCRRMKMNAVTGACLMTRRSIFEDIGGFSQEYSLGNYEDIEYCLEVRSRGSDVIYSPNSVVYHYAGGSKNYEMAKFNEALFRRRCREKLVYDEFYYTFGDGLR